MRLSLHAGPPLPGTGRRLRAKRNLDAIALSSGIPEDARDFLQFFVSEDPSPVQFSESPVLCQTVQIWNRPGLVWFQK
jgi:hypothetical protein